MDDTTFTIILSAYALFIVVILGMFINVGRESRMQEQWDEEHERRQQQIRRDTRSYYGAVEKIVEEGREQTRK